MATKRKPARRTARRPAAPRPARRQPESLRLRSVMPSLTVNDLQRSLAYYRDVLGFTVKERWEENGQLRGVELVAGTVMIGLSQDDFRQGRDRVKGVGHRLWCATSQDVDALAARVRARGGTIDEGPIDRWEMRFFTVTDPDGYKLSFSQVR